ncbi:MAG: DUF6449 domain-containing protein [Clostridia bacterium]|nr:DUF6449 domain-containing protein [Clostridia bacterium]
MTSKNCLRNNLLAMTWDTMKKNLWMTTLSTLAYFFALPVAAAVYVQSSSYIWNDTSSWTLENKIDRVSSFFTTGNTILCVLVIIGAFVASSFAFYYLHKRKPVDFYHSLPLKRDQLFNINYLAGAGAFLLPFTINFFIALIIFAISGASQYIALSQILTGFCLHLLYFMLIYSLLIIPSLLMGNFVLDVLMKLAFLFICTAAYGLYYGIMEVFYTTYMGALSNIEANLAYTSPAIRYAMTGNTLPVTTLDIVLSILGIALLYALGRFFCKKRPSEAAGNCLAFPRLKPVLKYPIMLVVTVGFGLFFYTINDSFGTVNYGDGRGFHLGWLFFGLLIGTFICDRIIEILYELDFRAIGRRWVPMLVFMAVICALAVVPITDATGYDKYRPDAEQVAQINADLGITDYIASNSYSYNRNLTSRENYIENNLSVVVLQEPANINTLLAIIDKSIANAQNRQTEEETVAGEEQYTGYVNLNILYTLKNGKEVGRSYFRVPMNQVVDELAALIDSEEFINSQLLAYKDAAVDNLLLSEINVFEQPQAGFSGIKLKRPLQEAVLEAYKADWLTLDSHTMMTELPVGSLAIYQVQDENGKAVSYTAATIQENGGYSVANNGRLREFQYPIYASFTKTLTALANCGVPQNSWQTDPTTFTSVTEDHYADRYNDYKYDGGESVTVEPEMPVKDEDYYEKYYEKGVQHTEYTDRADITRIINATVADETMNFTRFFTGRNNVSVYAVYDNSYTTGSMNRVYPVPLIDKN